MMQKIITEPEDLTVRQKNLRNSVKLGKTMDEEWWTNINNG